MSRFLRVFAAVAVIVVLGPTLPGTPRLAAATTDDCPGGCIGKIKEWHDWGPIEFCSGTCSSGETCCIDPD